MLTALRYRRLLRGWKAAAVAKRLRISASYYSRIESGQLRPSSGLRRQIARLFHVAQKTLFRKRPKPSRHP